MGLSRIASVTILVDLRFCVVVEFHACNIAVSGTVAKRMSGYRVEVQHGLLATRILSVNNPRALWGIWRTIHWTCLRLGPSHNFGHNSLSR